MSAVATLSRSVFTTSRLLEFFSEKELTMQIGHGRALWPIALVKELIDNALDACETAGVAPEITITVEPDAVTVQDNGPGLPVSTLTRSLDYAVRVSDKAFYISPTRGQLGNALKCLWAAPFVVDGQHGQIDVTTGGTVHTIDVTLDRIAGQPELQHTTSPDGLVKNGTRVRMHWPEIASYETLDVFAGSYKTPSVRAAVLVLVGAYAAFNPHARFAFRSGDVDLATRPTTSDWAKWKPNTPTSAHWYSREQLRDLIAAYIAHELEDDHRRTVREFISEFHGLSGTAKQKAIADRLSLSRARLADLAVRGDVNMMEVELLLGAMQHESRPVKPAALGTLGEEHLRERLAIDFGVDASSVRYKRVSGEDGRIPFVLEVAFGIAAEAESEREVVCGTNWTPALGSPFHSLRSSLGEARVDSQDPVVLIVHLARPSIQFTDRGKAALEYLPAVELAIQESVRSVTKSWTEAKRHADRQGRIADREFERLRNAMKSKAMSIKEAAYRVMEQAYLAASEGQGLANTRQVMYKARPLVQPFTGGKYWKNSSDFTQRFLPDYIEEHPEQTASWDVVYDARGHIKEPHTDRRVDLGTLEVRRYLGNWNQHPVDEHDDQRISIADHAGIDTVGPKDRYGAVLFVEKEGFDPLLERAQIADRFDIAVMSTKGMSVTAARKLVEVLSTRGVTVYVAHDLDKSGFSILHTLRTNTRRFTFHVPPLVVDLGLRLVDVQSMGLDGELVEYGDNADPRINLRASGATEQEVAFLVSGRSGNGRWRGQRVELNAMSSGQFIRWLQEKLTDAGVQKIVPDEETLAATYRRAKRLAVVQKTLDKLAKQEEVEVEVPANLVEKVKAGLADDEAESWDTIIWDIALQADSESEP